MGNFLIIPDRENVEEGLELCLEYGLSFELNDFMRPAVLDNEALCKEIVEKYKSYNAPIYTSHGDFYDVLVFSIDPKIAAISKERIYQSMEAAVAVGAKGVIFHSNIEPFLTADVYRDFWLKKNEEVFREVCEKYPSVNVYLENMFDTRPDDLANLAEVMSDVPNFGICFDYAHAFLTKTPTTPLSYWAEALSPYIKHVHINDNDGIEDLHLAVGSGVIDWLEFAKLREMYFPEATVLIETTPIEYQKKSLKYLRKIGLIK